MYRRNLALFLLAIVVIGLLAWAFQRAQAEPVEAVTTKWSSSGHAKRESESFRHWDPEDPPVIPTNCAKCHSTIGYLDFLGQDGSTAEKVDSETLPVGTTVECVACHNESSLRMVSVTFPSQAQAPAVDNQGNCMQCHQGRASAVQVDNAIQNREADAVSGDLAFISVHYRAAAATRLGSEVKGGYQYPGQEYAGYFEHVGDYQRCTDCHDAHSLRIDPNKCSPCHANVTGFGSLRGIRENRTDWSGEGDVNRGVAIEIEALKARLYDAVQAYAAAVAGSPIVYEPRANPYFFIDTNGDTLAQEGETARANSYKSWTPRLLRAAYNLHFATLEPGAYTHNPRYTIQLLHDSLADLGQRVDVDMAGAMRP